MGIIHPKAVSKAAVALLFFLSISISGSNAVIRLPYAPFCAYAYDYISYCLDFLTGYYYKPGPKCCNHIAKLNMIAKHRMENPQLLCFCIEYSVKGTQPPLLAYRIQALPLQCQTHLSFPISDSMDCSKV